MSKINSDKTTDKIKYKTTDNAVLPFISVIVPVKNQENTIGECIVSLVNSDYPSNCFEILVVDDHSYDNTASIVRSFENKNLSSEDRPDVKLLELQSKIGSSAARNLAISLSKGEIIVFTTPVCRVDKLFLTEICKPFTDPRIISCGGLQHACEDDPPFAKSVADLLAVTGMYGGYTKDRGPLADGMANNLEIRKVRHNPACCSAYRKRIFDYLLFDECLWPAEDLDFDIRLKNLIPGMIVFNHRAKVFHRRSDNFEKFISRIFNFGRFSGGRLTRRYGLFRPLSWVPLLTLASLYLSRKNKIIPIAILTGILIRIITVLKDADRILKILPLIPAGFITWIGGFAMGFLEE